MRRLSDTFMQALITDFLSDLRKCVVDDRNLDLEIRDNYLNIYYKGHSLLHLAEKAPGDYQLTIHPEFKKDLPIPGRFTDKASVSEFLKAIPHLKENIIYCKKPSLEIEYEQLIIRANNYEPRNATEYFIIDRQYVAAKIGRFDLTGIYWNRNRRRKGQTVPLCFMEIKFALNSDIQDVDQQMLRYYEAIQGDAVGLAEEAEVMLKQKLELGLFNQPENRLDAMKTLTISSDINTYQFILFLVDYNPFSSHLKLDKLAALPFASQVRIFNGGFALWKKNLKTPAELNSA